MSLLRQTLIVCTSHRVPSAETQESMRATGTRWIVSAGVSDTALARNIAFDAAIEKADEAGLSFVLLVDDDMSFLPADAEKLVEFAAKFRHPVSGAYVLANGKLAATLMHQADSWEKRIWYTGLGFMAIPVDLLRQLRKESKKVDAGVRVTHAYCWSGPKNGKWYSEDYTFCERFGGVHLAPIRAGHVKPVPLLPDAETLTSIQDGSILAEAAE